jgi:hypothetical protein
MITLHLTRANDDEGVYLKLPSSPAEIREAFSELDAISTDTSTTKITEAISNVYNLGNYLKRVNVEKPDELEKITALAVKLQTMDRDTCLKFEGVLDANSVNGIDDILRLSDMLDEYALLPDAANGSTLGKYLVKNGIVVFPENVQPYLDYQIIGSEFYADHGGSFCRGGYAVRKDELPERFLNVESEQKQKSVILLRLRASRGGHQTPIDTTLTLPATDEALERTKQKLGISEFAEAQIVTVDYVFPYFATIVPQDCISVEDVNELALSIEQMNQTDGEMLKYLAALDAEKPETFGDALRIAIDLDDYERVPSDNEGYGRMVLERLVADGDITNEIDGFMDFESFGKAWMREDGAVKTEFGQIRRLSRPFEPQSMGGMEMQ